MSANISRDQYDEDKRVIRKVFQKGTKAMDADFNEAFQVVDGMFRKLLDALSKGQDTRYGDVACKVFANTPIGDDVVVGGGVMGVHKGTLDTLLVFLDGAIIGPFTAWSGARTDYVYLEIEEVEVQPADDANIINPEVGEETCIDMRYEYSILISEGSTPAPVAGKTHVLLASITKTSGSDVSNSDITNLVPDFFTPEGMTIDGDLTVNEHTFKSVTTQLVSSTGDTIVSTHDVVIVSGGEVLSSPSPVDAGEQVGQELLIVHDQSAGTLQFTVNGPGVTVYCPAGNGTLSLVQGESIHLIYTGSDWQLISTTGTLA